MKLLPNNAARRKNDGGFIVIALMVILSILLIYSVTNLRYLSDLKRELQLLEKEQIKRLEKRSPKTTASLAATNNFSQTPLRALNP